MSIALSTREVRWFGAANGSSTDIDYQLRTFYPMDDYLRYEKDLLRHWFGAEFRQPKKLNNELTFLRNRSMKLFHKIIFWTHLSPALSPVW